MGKTLKRQRQKQQREQQQQHQQQRPSKLPRLANGAPLNSGSSSSKFTAAVSAALQEKRWLDAVTVLEAMQQYGKVPKLGAVQRWVRDADQAGSLPVTARLLDAILRCTLPQSPSSTAAPPAAAAAGPLEGSVVRHAPWLPPAAIPAAAEPKQPSPVAAQDAAGAEPVNRDADNQQQEQEQEQEQQPPSSSNDAGGLNKLAPPLPGVDQLRQLLYQVPFKAGAGGPDAIYSFPPNTIKFDSNHPAPTALPVPFVPGALLLQGVLSAAECQQIIAAAEAIGWHSDVDYTFGGAAGDDGGKQQQEQHQPQQEDVAQPTAQPSDQEQQQQDDTLEPQPPSAQPFNGANPAETATAAAGDDGGDDVGVAAGAGGSAARGLAAGLAGVPEGTPAAGCVWLADDSVLQPLYDRVSHLLPAEIEGGAYAGINARWRLYRYTPGAVYRPHVDGAWPGSGVDPETKEYVFDAYGDRWSRLTFLVYLNDGFEGGCTTYYTPSEKQVGVLDARGVVPVQGNVLVFPHGGTKGSLVHEGSAVIKGAKYVIRTDVLYMNPPKTAAGANGRSKPRAAAAAAK